MYKSVNEIVLFFNSSLLGKTSFYLYNVYARSETPCSSGFRGVKIALISVNGAIWVEKAYFCRVVK